MLVGDDQKSQIQQATSIVDLIGQQIRLVPKGKEFAGLCPFHDDSKPSMFVSPAKQIYKCFACGAGGDVFSWMTHYHKMTFPEALKHLADLAGIKLVRTSRGNRQDDAQQTTDRQRIAQANGQAMSFYQTLLQHPAHGQLARDYLQKRQISDEMTQAFMLGYAPDRWDGLAQMVGTKNWSGPAFELAGLIAHRSQGDGRYDRLRHRLIFPICDALGKPIAFGGRVLEGGTLEDPSDAKYLNSPETPLFNKSATLYGLHLAKKAMIDSRVAVIVEGYTDVIACHQAGFANVVATLGTSLTSQHVQMLKRFADQVVLLFDADAAGQKAADRAVELFLSSPIDVAVAVLPEGMDPADLLGKAEGKAVWQEHIDAATDALSYLFERMSQKMSAVKTTTGKARLGEDFLRQLAKTGLDSMGVMRKAQVVAQLAQLLHLKEQVVNDLLNHFASQSTRFASPASTAAPDQGDSEIHATDRHHQVDGEFRGIEADNTVSQTDEDAYLAVIGPENEKNIEIGVALSHSAPKIVALKRAAGQLVGGLLVEPDLFHRVQLQGRELYEVVTPHHLAASYFGNHGRLYQRLYEKLMDHQEMTLAGFLADLVQTGDQVLCNLATEMEDQAHQMADGDPQRRMQIVHDAAKALVRDLARSDDTEQAQAHEMIDENQLLEQVQSRLRSQPSGARIARLG